MRGRRGRTQGLQSARLELFARLKISERQSSCQEPVAVSWLFFAVHISASFVSPPSSSSSPCLFNVDSLNGVNHLLPSCFSIHLPSRFSIPCLSSPFSSPIRPLFQAISLFVSQISHLNLLFPWAAKSKLCFHGLPLSFSSFFSSLLFIRASISAILRSNPDLLASSPERCASRMDSLPTDSRGPRREWTVGVRGEDGEGVLREAP